MVEGRPIVSTEALARNVVPFRCVRDMVIEKDVERWWWKEGGVEKWC
jgi:hypothetical protein